MVGALALHAADIGSIPCIPCGPPGNSRNKFTSLHLGVSSEYCQVWPPNQNKMNRKEQPKKSIVDMLYLHIS